MQIEELKNMIEHSHYIVFLGGAGVSTESGIPDFRSEKGYFEACKKYGVPPETLLSHDFFMNDPEAFYDYYKTNLIFTDIKPNDAHISLAQLEETGKLKAIVTQNIDGLHQLAGSKSVYELHGSVYRNYCLECGANYGLDVIQCEGVPKCSVCGGIVRPDVVLYGEMLDSNVMDGGIRHIKRADMLIVGGTSLNVYPAAGLTNYFDGKYSAIINRDSTSYDSAADIAIHANIGETLKAVMQKLTI